MVLAARGMTCVGVQTRSRRASYVKHAVGSSQSVSTSAERAFLRLVNKSVHRHQRVRVYKRSCVNTQSLTRVNVVQ